MIKSFCMYGCFACVYVYTVPMLAAHGAQKKNPLELKLKVVGRYQVSVRNQTQLVCRSNSSS